MRVRLIVVACWMRRRWYVVAVAILALAWGIWQATGAVDAADERRESRERIESLANEVRDQNRRIEGQNNLIVRIAQDISNATSQESRDRSTAVLAGAIADIRRSQDCVAFYFNDERGYTACTEVERRLDAVRRGEDPFTVPRPPPTTAPTSGVDG